MYTSLARKEKTYDLFYELKVRETIEEYEED